MHKMLISTMMAGAAFVAVPASAAITVDTTISGVTLDFSPLEPTPTADSNIHVTNEVTNVNDIDGNTNAQGTGTPYVFHSSSLLDASVAGNGVATVVGPFHDLTFYAKNAGDAFSVWEGNFDIPNRVSPFYADIVVHLLGGNSISFLDVFMSDTGQNRFMIYGDPNDIAITSIDFTGWLDLSNTANRRSASFADLTQVKVTDVLPAVPEPATWAMMLMGFGVVGGAMRRRRKVSVSYQMA